MVLKRLPQGRDPLDLPGRELPYRDTAGSSSVGVNPLRRVIVIRACHSLTSLTKIVRLRCLMTVS